MTTVNTNMSDEVLAGGPGNFVTARYLRLKGTNREIGRALALVARREHGPAAGPMPSGGRTVQRVRRRWFEMNYPVLTGRMCGVADAFGVDSEDDEYDLGSLPTFAVPAGCSAVSYPGEGTKNGHGLLGRNYDFPTTTITQMLGLPPQPGERPLGANTWVIQMYSEGGLASITVGIMDVLGAMDGVNEAGLAVALLSDNESPGQEPSRHMQVGPSAQQIVRYLLDTCATVDEAKEALLIAKQYYFFAYCHFMVDNRSGQAFVWEYSPGHNIEYVVKSTGGRMVCTNHLLHRWPDPSQLPMEPDEGMTAAFTYRRYRILSELVGDGTIVDHDTIREQLAAVRFVYPVEVIRTLWQEIFDTGKPSLEVSFFLRDEGDKSIYSQPMQFTL